MLKDNLITISEIATKLRVSKHTVQAWISPSSPNHRSEFAAMARHAGRKTVFLEADIETWLNQRKGPLYSRDYEEVSAYWREKFVKSRGLLKGFVKTPEIQIATNNSFFSGGVLGIDLEPLLVWLTDGEKASDIIQIVNRADSLVLPVILSHWLLARAQKNQTFYEKLKEFLLNQNIFILAPFNEEALNKILELDFTISDFNVQVYCSSMAAKADFLLTSDKFLLKQKGLNVIAL